MNASIDASIQIHYNEIVIGYMLLNVQRFSCSGGDCFEADRRHDITTVMS